MVESDVDPKRSAILVLDFTTGIVDTYATKGRSAASNAAVLCDAMRAAGALIFYVIPAHFDVDGKPFLRTGALIDAFTPQQGDQIVYKSRIGAFSTTALDVMLRQAGRDTLIVTGIATSGTVLSTTRQGYDMGYRMIVAEDACSDAEEAVHALLTTHVHKESWIGLWRIANVFTTQQLIARIGQ